MANKIILGIDPGSRLTGYGVISFDGKNASYLTSGCVRITAGNIAERLQQIYTGVREIIAQFAPQEMAIEQVFMHQKVWQPVTGVHC